MMSDSSQPILEVQDLTIALPSGGDRACLGAGLVAFVDQAQQLADFVE